MAYNGGLGTAPALGGDSGAIVWRHPTLDLEVYVQPTPAGMIPEQAQQGLKGKPPAEIGGLLLGGIIQNHRMRTFLVTAAEFVPCEGSSYLSARLNFNSLIAAAKKYKPAGNLHAIGFFRSNLREGFTITEEDLAFMRDCFPAGECVALLIRPYETGACMARFFLAENATVQEDSTGPDVPVAEIDPELASRKPSLPVDDSSPHKLKPPAVLEQSPASPFLVRDSREAPLVSRHSGLPQPQPAVQSSVQTYGKFAAVLICAALAATGFYLYTQGQPARERFSRYPQPSSPAIADRTPPELGKPELGLGLEVARPMPGELDVSWRRDLLMDATGGAFTITDGAMHRTVALDSAQLHDGKLTYFPRNPDVLFKLDVNLPEGHSVSESIRVVGSEVITARSSKPMPIAKTATAAPSPTATGSTPEPAPAAAVPGADPTAQAGQKSAPVSGTPPALPEIDNSPASNMAPAEVLSGNLRLPPMQEPPKAVTPEPVKPLSLQAPAPQSPLAPAPQENPSGIPGNEGKPALAPHYFEPKPVRQILPDIRSIFPAGVKETTRVEVAVQVNKKGRVTDAHLRTPKSVLTGMCLMAAREWTFTPATLNNQKVDSSYIITFVFRPQKFM